MSKIYDSYFYNIKDIDRTDGAYKELEVNQEVPTQKLKIPELLKPDNQTETDTFYTVEARTGDTQFLPGKKTKTFGYNANYLGKTIVFENGKNIHINLKNSLPILTTFHWHGLNVSGPIVDGGCHAPVYPGETNHIDFTVDQPAATLWLHAHPCPATAQEVWKGLATMVLIKDKITDQLPIPKEYGINDIPLILQDRNFHEDNQFNYRKDYDPDGTLGTVPLINGTINPYFEVKTQKVRFRILNGSNRREWRLHFSDDLTFAQIGSDGGLLEEPVYMKKLMITCAERDEVVVDFGNYQPGDQVILYSDKTPILTLKIHNFKKDSDNLPDHLVDIVDHPVTENTKIHEVLMSGMDETVAINGKKFNMQRIDDRQQVGNTEYWDITNNNEVDGGMIHPYHMHGTLFKVVSRNGQAPYPNELGLKDTISVNPNETVRIKVTCPKTGVYMNHCHILEHEDGGMMAQFEVFDPNHPKEYQLMDMNTLMQAFAKELKIPESEVWLGGMDSYEKTNTEM